MTDYSISPLIRREGRKETKVFHSREGLSVTTSVTTWDQLLSLPAVENFCFFSFPPSCSGGRDFNLSPIPFLPLMALPISIMLNYLGVTHVFLVGRETWSIWGQCVATVDQNFRFVKTLPTPKMTILVHRACGQLRDQSSCVKSIAHVM